MAKEKKAGKKTVKLKLRKKSGTLVDYPYNTVKKILVKAGLTGKALAVGTTGVFREAASLAKAGIVTAADLEKAIVDSVTNTNHIIANMAKKITKEILK